MAAEARPAVFLDRDGVINVDRGYVGFASEFFLIGGAAEAISLLNRMGYFVFVVTNQSGIGHGYYSESDFRVLTEYMKSVLARSGARIDDLRYCPFHPNAKLIRYRTEHPWRKPAPGMIVDLLQRWPCDLDSSFMIGDSMRDVAAAKAAGVEGYLFSGENLLDFVKTLLPRDFAQ